MAPLPEGRPGRAAEIGGRGTTSSPPEPAADPAGGPTGRGTVTGPPGGTASPAAGLSGRGTTNDPSGRAASAAAGPTGRATVKSPPERAGSPGARLTGRGAVLAMAGMYLIGLLLAAWLGWAVLAGLAFVAGCVLAARYAAPAALLTVVVSPPLLFLAAVIFVSAVTVPGGLFMSVVVGSVVTLASVAPWLAVGMVLTVIITWIRGLPGCIRDLHRELRSG